LQGNGHGIGTTGEMSEIENGCPGLNNGLRTAAAGLVAHEAEA
jgi:hypothetical protein